MKKLIHKILDLFDLMIIKKKYYGVIDKRLIFSFQKSNNNYNLYYEGLSKSGNKHTDNFWKRSRHLDLLNLLVISLEKNLEGDFAEAGCWKGHSTYMISKLISSHLKKHQGKKLKFHVFDSFEGLSEIQDEDENIKNLNQSKIDHIRKQFQSDENFVRNKVLGNFDFVKTYKGWIPERFAEVKNLKFSFVHIDVDLYEPTTQTLEFFFPRLVNGGFIVCDDYNSLDFNGARKAWDNFFSKNKVSFNFAPTLGSSFIIK